MLQVQGTSSDGEKEISVECWVGHDLIHEREEFGEPVLFGVHYGRILMNDA